MNRPLPLIVCLLVPFLIVVFGLVLAGLYGYRQIPNLIEETARGFVPEGFTATLPEPAKYTVWLHVTALTEGEDYRGPEELPPGGRVYIFDASSGREIPLNKWLDATKHIAGEKAVSLGTFETNRVDQRVELEGSGIRDPVLISITPANTGRALGVVLSLIGIVFLSLSVGIIAFFILLHRRQRGLQADAGG